MLRVAVVLLLVIGLSGLSVGIGLVAAMAAAGDAARTGIAIGAAIGAYGLAAAIAAIALIRRPGRRPWWLAVGTALAGFLFLVGLVVAVGDVDPVLAFGIVIWGAELACLLAPDTRAAVGAGRGPAT